MGDHKIAPIPSGFSPARPLSLTGVPEILQGTARLQSPFSSAPGRVQPCPTPPPACRCSPMSSPPHWPLNPPGTPTVARAAAGSAAGAIALAPSGSGRLHGTPSSLPEPGEPVWGRPEPTGDESPAAAAEPRQKPWQPPGNRGRKEGSRTGAATTQVPRSSVAQGGRKIGRRPQGRVGGEIVCVLRMRRCFFPARDVSVGAEINGKSCLILSVCLVFITH